MSGALNEQGNWLQGEIMRRLFWAGWLHVCISSDDYVVGSAADRLALETPLLVCEESFISEKEEPSRTLSDALDKASSSKPFSGWAETLQLVFFWCVHPLVSCRR